MRMVLIIRRSFALKNKLTESNKPLVSSLISDGYLLSLLSIIREEEGFSPIMGTEFEELSYL